MKRYYLPKIIYKAGHILGTLLLDIFLVLGGAWAAFLTYLGGGCGIEDTCTFKGGAYIVYILAAILIALAAIVSAFMLTRSSISSYRQKYKTSA